MLKRLLHPLSRDMMYTVLMWFLLGGPRCFLIQHLLSSWRYTAFFVLAYFVGAYLLTFLISLCGRFASYLRSACWFVATVIASINTLLIVKYHSILSNHFFEIFLGTNQSEIREFFSSQVSCLDLLPLCMVFFLSVLGYSVYRKMPLLLDDWKLVVPISFLVLSSAATIHNPAVVRDIFMDFGFSFDEVVDLRQHVRSADIVATDSIHPQNVIVLIGESFAKRHSSLYGYDKPTNPRLSQYIGRGEAVVFDSVQSPHISTTESFRYILTDYATVANTDAQVRWYDCHRVPDLFMQMGYHTVWFSNQIEKGLWDNLPASYSYVCHESLFSSHLANNSGLDEILLSMHPQCDSPDQKKLIFYHLMGQHSDYEARYPVGFGCFQPSDYPSSSSEQATVLAAYDNATLYNDSIVDALIALYSNGETIAFYFPDHGLDLYVSDPHFEGHARSDAASFHEGVQIPFFVYVSPAYQQRAPEVMCRLRRYASQSLNTNRFIQLITDIAGYSYH